MKSALRNAELEVNAARRAAQQSRELSLGSVEQAKRANARADTVLERIAPIRVRARRLAGVLCWEQRARWRSGSRAARRRPRTPRAQARMVAQATMRRSFELWRKETRCSRLARAPSPRPVPPASLACPPQQLALARPPPPPPEEFLSAAGERCAELRAAGGRVCDWGAEGEAQDARDLQQGREGPPAGPGARPLPPLGRVAFVAPRDAALTRPSPSAFLSPD